MKDLREKIKEIVVESGVVYGDQLDAILTLIHQEIEKSIPKKIKFYKDVKGKNFEMGYNKVISDIRIALKKRGLI